MFVDEGGCLRLEHGGGFTEVPIWPPRFDLRTEGGEVRVLDGEGGIVARVGDRVEMGGGEVWSLAGIRSVDGRTRRELEERCPGPYWLVGETVRAFR